MKLASIAPHLVGRMLPPLFVMRLPAPMWYWMHATGCAGGLFRARRAEPSA